MSGDANFQLWKVDFLARYKRLPNLSDAWQAGREFGHGDTQMAPPAEWSPTLQRTAAELIGKRRYADLWNTKSPDDLGVDAAIRAQTGGEQT